MRGRLGVMKGERVGRVARSALARWRRVGVVLLEVRRRRSCVSRVELQLELGRRVLDEGEGEQGGGALVAAARRDFPKPRSRRAGPPARRPRSHQAGASLMLESGSRRATRRQGGRTRLEPRGDAARSSSSTPRRRRRPGLALSRNEKSSGVALQSGCGYTHRARKRGVDTVHRKSGKLQAVLLSPPPPSSRPTTQSLSPAPRTCRARRAPASRASGPRGGSPRSPPPSVRGGRLVAGSAGRSGTSSCSRERTASRRTE